MRSRLTCLASPLSLTVTALPSLVVPTYLAPPGSAAMAAGAAIARTASAAGIGCLRRSMACGSYNADHTRRLPCCGLFGGRVRWPRGCRARGPHGRRARAGEQRGLVPRPPALFVVADGMGGA